MITKWTKEQKMLSAFANILYVKEGIRISPTDLKSTKADKILPDHILNVIKKYEEYFNKIEEIVEFIDDVRHPTGRIKIIIIGLLNAVLDRNILDD